MTVNCVDMIRQKVLATAMLLFISGCEYPGGLPPTYPAKDDDPQLSKHAESVVPIIDIVEEFHKRNSRYPKDATEILAELPNAEAEKDRWDYQSDDDGYRISIRVGWDPLLVYESVDDVWIFDPGDGSPSKQIELQVDMDH